MTANLPYPKDFSDWLPPILVKELRQGLKANVFGVVLVFMQSTVIVLMGLRLLSEQNDDISVRDLDRYLWMAIAVSLLVFLPLRGLSAISDETTQRTLDLVQLTHMSSFKIVWGKWVALVSLTMLFVTALLPYQVLFYFYGGIDVVANLKVLGWMCFGSLILTAFFLAISGTTLLVRIVSSIMVAGPVYGLTIESIDFLIDGHGSVMKLHTYLGWLFFGLMAIPFLLAVTAARIGHSSENGSALIRGVALVTLVAAPIGSFLADGRDGVLWLVLAIPFGVWAGIESMTEQASALPSLYLPAVRRGSIGRVFGMALHRGWGSGLIFVAVATALLFATGLLEDSKSFTRGYHVASLWSEAMLHLGMVIVFPAVFLCALPSVRQRHWLYIIIQICCFLWFLEIQSIQFRTTQIQRILLSCLPMGTFMTFSGFSRDYDPSGSDTRHATALISDAIFICWLLYRSRSEFRTIREGEAKACRLFESLPKPSSVSAPTDL